MSKGDRRQKSTIEGVARLAMRFSQGHLADYGATRSRHDFTQRQLLSCLVIRAYLKTTYRGVLEVLAISPVLRQELGLNEKLPHYTTLQKFSARSKVLEIVLAIIQRIGTKALEQSDEAVAAMDSSGLATTTASAYFQSRRGKPRRSWVKISTIVPVWNAVAYSAGTGPWAEQRSGASARTVAAGNGCWGFGKTLCRRGLRCRVDP
jgi:hypothetical protein